MRNRCVLLESILVGLAGLYITILLNSDELPAVVLRNGGEVRVLKASFGTNHSLGRAPEIFYRTWYGLPKLMRGIFPPLPRGAFGQMTDEPSVSVWWAWFDPLTGKAKDAKASRATMILDSGERVQLDWIHAENKQRQILISDVPFDSSTLTFLFAVNDEPLSFSVDNPAFRQSKETGGAQGIARSRPAYRTFSMPLFDDAEGEGQGIGFNLVSAVSRPSGSENVELVYTLTNRCSSDLFLLDGFPDPSWAGHDPSTDSGTRPLGYTLLQQVAVGVLQRSSSSAQRTSTISFPVPIRRGDSVRVPVMVKGYFPGTGQMFEGSFVWEGRVSD